MNKFTDDQLREYYEKCLSISECSRHFGATRETITKHLKRLGLYNKGFNPQKIIFRLTKEDAETYLSSGKTIKEISEIVGGTQEKVSSLIKSYGLCVRRVHNKIENIPSRDELYSLYWNDMKPFTDIANVYGVSNVTVRKWFKQYGINTRTQSETSIASSEKRCITNLSRYGISTLLLDTKFQEKCQQLRFEKHGPLNIGVESKEEKEFIIYLNSLGCNFTKNISILSGKELDGYDENRKIAVEYCGLYWHTEKFGKSRLYHYNKYRTCISKDIRLITIFGDEWKYRNSQVKNFFKSILEDSQIRVFARKCVVKYIDSRTASCFISQYHIQPIEHNHIKHAVGIFMDSQLLGVMSFGRHHRNSNNKSIVLNRLVFATGVCVVGGASKMLQYFVSNYGHDYSTIISWSDNRLSLGDVYSKMGFTKCDDLHPDYSYIDLKHPKKRIPKQSCTKDKLTRLLGTCDSTLKTERQLADALGYSRIWDCGKIRWVYDIHA